MIGIHDRITLQHNTTAQLWGAFGPRLAEIKDRVSPNLFAIQVYDDGVDVRTFTPETEFEMWAAVAVPDGAPVPAGMEALAIPAGRYAVFIHRGPARTFQATTSRYIFQEWLPVSGYTLDARPHFQVMAPGYRPDDPEAEEEIWVPIK